MPHYKAPDNSLHYLSAADISNGGEGLLPAGSVSITEEDAEALKPLPPQPTAMERIRALEAQNADAQAKATRQIALKTLLDEAMTYPQAAGLTRAEVHEVLMTNRESTYAKLFVLESEIEALREQL